MVITRVKLVNRTSKDLVGVYDGRQHVLPAGSTTEWPEVIAFKFRDQNPRFGTENIYTGAKQYLLGIIENSDPIDPIEQSDAPSVIDFRTIYVPPGARLEQQKGNGVRPMDLQGFNSSKQSPEVIGFTPNNDIPGNSVADRVELPPVYPPVSGSTPHDWKP